MSEIKVSVIVPVYNIEKYIERCLHSLLGQDFADMEIIVVNDGSKDGSLNIVKQIACKDERIKIVDKVNGGLSSARNAGIEVAKGKYVLHIDGDDWIEQGYISDMHAFAEREDLDIVVTDFFFDWDNGKFIYAADAQLNKKIFTQQEYFSVFFEKGYPAVWNKLFKRSLYVDNKIIHPLDITVGEDLVTTPRLIYFANKIGKINKPYVHYIQRATNISLSTSNMKKANDLYLVVVFLEEFFKDKDFTAWESFYRFKVKTFCESAVRGRHQQSEQWLLANGKLIRKKHHKKLVRRSLRVLAIFPSSIILKMFFKF